MPTHRGKRQWEIPWRRESGLNWMASEYSAATGGSAPLGEGGGPTDTQRFVFGYPRRTDYVDTTGNAWRPGVEFVARTGAVTDTVARIPL